MEQKIGFVGLGQMRQPMVRNLLNAGMKVKVYNRTKEKAKELLSAGAVQVQTLSDVVQPGGVLITMIANDQALDSFFHSFRAPFEYFDALFHDPAEFQGKIPIKIIQ